MKLRLSFLHPIFIMIGLAASFNSQAIQAEDCGGPVLQLGWFTATQGKSQHVNIEGLIGDDFSVHKSSDQNFLAGIGYYFDGLAIAQTRARWLSLRQLWLPSREA